MPVIQSNIFLCDVCGHTSHTVENTILFSDPVVRPPNNEPWAYKSIPLLGEVLLCPRCVLTAPTTTPDPR